ncbi:para-aminobenzoate synthase, (PABA), partial [Coemansia sp. RSA 2703]
MPSITTKHGSYPRTLLVDNYDSYTFNILQLLISQCQAHKVDPSTHILVIRNDQHAWPTVRDRILPHIDSIVISPGPGTPERAEDFGVCTQLISDSRLPLLGVCLGHQGIAAAFGGHVRKSSVPVHGQTSTIEVVGENTGIFEHMPRRSSVVRYHSLTVDEAGFPHDELEVLARACGTVKAWVDGCVADVQTSEIMALRHRRRPLFGVQFHPESVCSEHGAQIIANFQA